MRLAARAPLALVPLLATLMTSGPAGAASGLYIRGGGDGHGVGMSQYGALGYALHGDGYAAILNHYYTGTALGTTNPNHIITVFLSDGAASFSGASAAGRTALSPHTTYTVVASGGRLELRASGRTRGPFTAPLTVSGSGPLTLTGVGSYRGSLEFWPQAGGGVETVNAIDIEDYVRGVVAGEMLSSWPAQALDVQAVAARTFALTVTPQTSTFDVYPDTRSQMYGGVAAETPATDAAVAATHGQVVTYRGTPVLTPFSSSSGGYTESIQDAWPGSVPEPWLVSVPDPYDGAGGNPDHHWSFDLSVAQASATLGGLVKGSLIGIRPTAQDHARLVMAQVVGTGGRTTVTASQLEQLFGLLSTNMAFTTITASPGTGSSSRATRRTHRRTAGAPGSGGGTGKLHLHGTIFPASAGALVTVQRLGSRGYTTVAVTRTAASGAYQANVVAPGRYRVLYDHIDGPTVTIASQSTAAARARAAVERAARSASVSPQCVRFSWYDPRNQWPPTLR